MAGFAEMPTWVERRAAEQNASFRSARAPDAERQLVPVGALIRVRGRG
jgi:hypothetical protein